MVSDKDVNAAGADAKALGTSGTDNAGEAASPGYIESIPIGLHTPPPEKEAPEFYHTNATTISGKDGPVTTFTVGPFDLSTQDIKGWADKVKPEHLNELVEQRRLRPSTALVVNSAQFKSVLRMMEAGQQPTPEMIERVVPGDLQRVIANEVMGK